MDIIQQLDLATSKKPEIGVGWLREYSSVHMAEARNLYLDNCLKNKGKDTSSQMSTPPSIDTINKTLEQNKADLEGLDKSTFNIWRFSEKVGRKQCLSTVTIGILRMMGLHQHPKLSYKKFMKFLGKIYQGYSREV